MSLNIADNFSYLGRKPLDSRFVFDTVEDMTSAVSSQLYTGLLAYNIEAKQYYMYDANNLNSPWTPVNNSSIIEPYVPGNNYKQNSLIYLDDIQYRVVVDFTANNTENTSEENLNIDIQLGNLTRMTPEKVSVPECLGTFMSDDPNDLPTDVVKGNWGLVLDCTVNAPGQPGIALYNGTSWEIAPIPQGELQFPEPIADGSMNFRVRQEDEDKGSWVPFSTLDGNTITVNIKSETNSNYVPKAQELVWNPQDNTLLIGDGSTTLMDLVPFYSQTITKEDVITALGYTPENIDNRGVALGYAPLDKDGLVPKANLPIEVTDTYSKTEIDNKDADTLNSATILINTEAQRATDAETAIADDLQEHIDNTGIHVTQDEKDAWNAKVDADDLQNFENHMSDTAIHVTQSDKDRWDGMNKAYFVTNIDDLPTTDNEIGNIGYVQTSAAGVSPIVCDQYIWNGTKWEKIDSSGVSLTFNWGNLEGKPASTPLSLDNAVTIAHSHVNKTVLDKIGQSDAGDFTFDGIPIGIRAVFLENENGLPEVGLPNTLYVVYADARVRNFPSISVYRDGAFQVLGRGTQDAPPTVGEMSILQMEYFGVQANSKFNITVSPDTSFCFLPVEILKEQEGDKDITNTLVNCGEPANYLYDATLFDMTPANKLQFNVKSIPTIVDTVGDYYFSHADIDLSNYYNITGIE